MSDFHLLRPEWILLILPLAILFFFKQIKPLKAGNWQSVISPKLQQYVLSNTQQKTSQRFTQVALWLSALLAILALSGPSWQKQSSEVYRSQQGLIIGFDLSLSMTSQDVAPSRVQRAKYKIMDVLKAQRGQNIGLIAYAGDAHVVSPLTQDTNTVKSLLTPLDPYIMPSQGSNLVSLAQETANLFEQAGSSPRTLLLITDGVESRDIQPAADILNAAGIRLAILAVGTEQGAPMVQPDGRFFKDSTGQVIMPPLEWDNLQQLASATGAQIKRLSNSDSDISALLSAFTQLEHFEKDDDESKEFDQWLDSGYWLLLPMILLCLGAFRKGIILSVTLFIFMQPNDSVAQINLPDVLLNGDQQGEKYFEQNPTKAAESFNDPKWKASSLYKAGDYQGALDIWQQFDDAESLYNQGNALTKMERFDEAIEHYDQALEKKPSLDDARANKSLATYLKQVMKKQEEEGNGDEQKNKDGLKEDENGDKTLQKPDENSKQGSSDGNKNDKDSYKEDPNGDSKLTKEDPNGDSKLTKEDPDGDSKSTKNDDGDQSEKLITDSENTDSNNPIFQAQTEEEKQRQEEMDAMKEKMAQQTQDEQNDENEGEQNSLQSQPKSQADLEQEQAMQQWIQRIPDDPGGLLRNKFLYQYQQRQGNTEQNGERKPW